MAMSCMAVELPNNSEVTWPEVVWPGLDIGADYRGQPQPQGDWSITRVQGSVHDQCYQVGDAIDLSVTLANSSTTAVSLSGTWHWFFIGDATADQRGGVRYVVSDILATDTVPDTVVPAEATTVLAIPILRAPERRGTIALFLRADDGKSVTTRWVTNVLVLWPTASEPIDDSMFFGDARGVRQWQRNLELATLGKLGVKWTRAGVDMNKLMPKPGVFDFHHLDDEIEPIRALHMRAIFLGGAAPSWTQPYGRLAWPRNNPQKQDSTPSPLNYGDWADYWESIIARHKDVIRAVNVWNEPWEVGGISNWGGTGAHYRNLQRFAKIGVMRADPTVLVGGNDSDNNIVDNLLCDPSWGSYTDLLTVHGFTLPGAYVHALNLNKPLWQTELWYTAFSDRSVQWQLFERARGCTKVNLLVLCNAFSAGYRPGGYYNPSEKDTPNIVPQPNAAAYNTMTHFLEGMDFINEPNAWHLPYVFCFTRRQATTTSATHQAVAVLFGQNIDPDKSEWWQVEAGEHAQARLASIPGITGVYDRYGHSISLEKDGSYVIPFDTRAVYVTAEHADALSQIPSALHVLKYERPLHLGFHDPLGALTDGAVFSVRMTNALPMALDVSLSIEALGGWRVDLGAVPARIEAGETLDIPLTLRGQGALVEGQIGMSVTAITNVGTCRWSESIRDRRIRRFTPPMGATIADWRKAGIVPTVITARQSHDEALRAAMPWEDLTSGTEAIGRWAVAYDTTHVHIFAELHYAKRGDLPWDQSRNDWYSLHPGGYAYERAPNFPFTGEHLQLALDVVDNEYEQLYPNDSPFHRRYPMRSTDYVFGFYETRQGPMQAWLYHRPGGPWRHRYPFSPMDGLDQMIPPGVTVDVRRDDTAELTTFSVSIPLSLMPEIQAKPGRIIRGLEIKLGTGSWNGIFSAASKGSCKEDQSVFQPYWRSGYSAEIPWICE